MIVSWIYFRLWYFPVHLIWGIHWECYEDGRVCPKVNLSMLSMLLLFTCALACLHVFWFYLMVMGLVRRFKSKAGFSQEISLKSSVNR